MRPESDRHQARGRPVLLYDGACGLCTRLVQWVLRVEREHSLRFSPLQGALFREVHRRHPEVAGVDTVIWLEPSEGAAAERVFLRSDAALRLADYLGGPWRAFAQIARLVPRAVRDRLYDQVARRRARWFGPASSCPVPSAQQQARLLP